MADERRRAAWEDLNITKDELNRIGNALKNEEFRKLLVQYAEEVNDPENKKIFEEEIKLLEKERGVDCTFINPEPGYVIKSSIDGERKAFVNICKNDNIGKPSSEASSNAVGKRGLNWSLPYSQAPPRDDLDKKFKRCSVFDVVFHPDTLRMAEKNSKFRDMVNDTALDAVEKNYNVKLDRKNLKFPKMAFKGISQPTVIRKKSADTTCESGDDASSSAFPFPYPYPYESLKPEENVQTPVREAKSAPKQENLHNDDDTPYTTPKHTIKYRNSVDIQDFANDRDAKINAAIPNDLVVTIHLPLLSSTADVILDVNEKWIHLKSTKIAKYFLHLPLPYAVSDELGNAKFDKSERKLVLTLPVKRTNKTVSDLSREDSGVESDPGVRTVESEEDEKEESVPLIEIVNMSNQVDNFERTMANLTIDNFLNPDYHYSLPPFTCNVADNVLAFTLHVKNVEPDSVKHKLLFSNNGVQMCFSSLGSGFFPLHYGFYVELPVSFTVAEDGVSIETWDNNVIVQIVLNPCDSLLTSYFVGMEKESSTCQDLPEPAVIGQKFAHLLDLADNTADDEGNTDFEIQVMSTEGDVVIDIIHKEDAHVEQDCKKMEEALPVPLVQNVPKKQMSLDMEKTRSYSESSSDEMNLCPTKRGILKCRSVNRSLSESNAEDYCYSPSLDNFPQSFSSESCIPEEDVEGSLESKKTVRFNEVVYKKTFRTNCSILGQRKKNQRKVRNKKRAQERRASESENSEGESDKVKQKTKSTNQTEESSIDMTVSNDKMSSSSGSGDEACDSTDVPESYEKPNDFEKAMTKTQPTPSRSMKRSRKSKKNSKKVQKPQHLDIHQLGFKNDFMFDLDM